MTCAKPQPRQPELEQRLLSRSSSLSRSRIISTEITGIAARTTFVKRACCARMCSSSSKRCRPPLRLRLEVHGETLHEAVQQDVHAQLVRRRQPRAWRRPARSARAACGVRALRSAHAALRDAVSEGAERAGSFFAPRTRTAAHRVGREDGEGGRDVVHAAHVRGSARCPESGRAPRRRVRRPVRQRQACRALRSSDRDAQRHAHRGPRRRAGRGAGGALPRLRATSCPCRRAPRAGHAR